MNADSNHSRRAIVPKKTLRINLERLREELATPDALDPETRQMLASVAADIDRVLGEEDVQHASLPAKLEELTIRFEANHPKLAGIISEVADALAKIGI